MDELILFIVLISLFFTISLLIIDTIKTNKRLTEEDIIEELNITKDNYKKNENKEYYESNIFEKKIEEKYEQHNKANELIYQHNINNNPSKEKTTIGNQENNYEHNNSANSNQVPIYYHNYLYNYHPMKETYICDEKFKEEYCQYASEYEDLDYYDYIGTKINIESIYKKPNIFYNYNYFDEDYYKDDYDYYYEDDDYEDEYNNKIKLFNNFVANTNQKTNNNQQYNQYSKKKSNSLTFNSENQIDEYIISLFGKENVEKRDIKKQETVNTNEKSNEDENIDKYLKMFFGENCDVDKLKNNQDKKDIH